MSNGSPLDLVRIGLCPTCRGALGQEANAYVCLACGARWPIVGGVPRFVGSQHYTGSFGYQWRRHRRTQHQDRVGEETFRQRTGLTPEDVRGKLVLDVGVGTGRFSEVVARWGGYPVGVDLSLAVLSARRNLDQYGSSAFVAQADLFRLPFREESFDVVYSIGVLHHTPSTRDAFREIARYAKPGGIVAAAVYEDFPEIHDFSTRYRRYTTEMSHSLLHFLCHLALPARSIVEASRWLGPAFEAEASKIFYTSIHGAAQWRILDTFDWYAPRFQWRHEEAEVKRWFVDLGFEDVERLPERSMMGVRGRRGSGPLRAPPSSVEGRAGFVEPLPGWIPPAPLRDVVLGALLGSEVLRAALEVWGARLARVFSQRIAPPTRRLTTSAVVATKHALGIEGDVLGRS